MIYDHARALAAELKASDEYLAYKEAKERAFANESTRALLAEYQKLRRKAQGTMLSGESSEELMGKLQKLGEVLQFDADASAYLMAEYRISMLLGDLYKILAEAVDISLSEFEG